MKSGNQFLPITLGLLITFLLLTLDSKAQSLSFGSKTNAPLKVFAESGIEWQQEELVFVARGNASAVRGKVTVLANELRAYYRETPGGETNIWRLDAIGKVRVKSPHGNAYGEHGVYNLDDSIIVLTGSKPVKLITPTDIIVANRQIEFWEKRQMAVARGDAVAKRAEKELHAEVLAAYFKRNKMGETELHRVEAFDKVKVKTPKDTAISQRAVYNAKSGIATLSGDVKIIRGENRLTGCSAEVNLNTGISRIRTCDIDTKGGTNRVKGIVWPQKRRKQNK
ncbi:MAG: hypothetical protein CMF69_01240 [Magnetovibrio sp.]|nr:hypothetical protein [Magnetovibrio sp.]